MTGHHLIHLLAVSTIAVTTIPAYVTTWTVNGEAQRGAGFTLGRRIGGLFFAAPPLNPTGNMPDAHPATSTDSRTR